MSKKKNQKPNQTKAGGIPPVIVPALPPTGQLLLNVTAFVAVTTGHFCTLGDTASGLPPTQILLTGNSSIGYVNNDPMSNGILVRQAVVLSFGLNSLTGVSYRFAGLSLVGLSSAFHNQ